MIHGSEADSFGGMKVVIIGASPMTFIFKVLAKLALRIERSPALSPIPALLM